MASLTAQIATHANSPALKILMGDWGDISNKNPHIYSDGENERGHHNHIVAQLNAVESESLD